MSNDDFVSQLRPVELLSSGFTVGGGVSVYYNELMKKGVCGSDIFLLQNLMGSEWDKFKQTLRPVPMRDEELPEPVKNTNYGGWESGYITLMKKAKIPFRHEKDAFKDYEALPHEVELSDKVTLRPDQLEVFDISKRAGVGNWVTATPEGFIVSGKMQGVILHALEKTPYYQPTYVTKIPDLGIIKKMGKLTRQVEEARREEFVLMYLSLVDATGNYVLSNGNFAGQLGRILKGRKVRADIMSTVGGASNNLLAKTIGVKFEPGPLFSPQITFEDYQTIMRKRAPFAPKHPRASLYSDRVSTLMLTFNLVVDQDNCRLITVNKDASSGQLFRVLKKKDTTVKDALLADWLLQKLLGCVRGKRLNEEMYTALWENYGALFCPQTKNKSEIGERAKLQQGHEVWRNYFVFNSFTQMPAQILCENIYNRWDKLTQQPVFKNKDNPEIWSLLGWSCYGNGLEDLLTTMARQAKEEGHSLAVYSDNVYLLMYIEGEFYWFSLDGSSMECSLSKGDAQYFMRHVIEDYWKGDVTQAWRIYGETFYKDLAVDSRCLLGALQWQNDGQCSGTGGTAYLNNGKMIIRGEAFNAALKARGAISPLKEGVDLPSKNSTKVLGERALHYSLDHMFSYGGVYMKVELVTHTDLFNILLGEDRQLPDGVISLDILGMDAAWIPTVGVIGGLNPVYPILNKDKLIRAVAYNKMSDKLSTNQARIIESMRLKALYLLGAWRYAALGDLIRDRIGSSPVVKSAKARVEEGEGPYESVMIEAIKDFARDLDPEAITEISVVIGSLGLPYFFDVLRTYKNIDYARRYLIHVVETEGVDKALLISSVSTLVQAIALRLTSVEKAEAQLWVELLERNGRLQEVSELVEISQENVTGETESVGDFKNWLKTIRKNLVITPRDKIKFDLVYDQGDFGSVVVDHMDDIVDAMDFLGPAKSKPHESSYAKIIQLRNRLNLRSFSDSNTQKIGETIIVVSAEQQPILDKIMAHVKEVGVPLGDLYNYSRIMTDARLTEKERAIVKKDAFGFITVLDRKLDRLLGKTMVVSNPDEMDKTTLIKKEREARKQKKKDEKELKQMNAVSEAEKRHDLTLQQHRQEKKEAKKVAKEERGEKESQKEEEERPTPKLHPLHAKPLLHWLGIAVAKGIPPPPAPGVLTQAFMPTGDTQDLLKNSGPFGQELRAAHLAGILSEDSLERILAGIKWIKHRINSGTVSDNRAGIMAVAKFIKERLAGAEAAGREDPGYFTFPSKGTWAEHLFSIPFYSPE
nr:MAG: RNA-dependent RNA polymerase [Henan sediment birna-like virus 1]